MEQMLQWNKCCSLSLSFFAGRDAIGSDQGGLNVIYARGGLMCGLHGPSKCHRSHLRPGNSVVAYLSNGSQEVGGHMGLFSA